VGWAVSERSCELLARRADVAEPLRRKFLIAEVEELGDAEDLGFLAPALSSSSLAKF